MAAVHHPGFVMQYACVWTSHEEYLVVQTLAGINAVVLIVFKFLYFASLA